MNAWFRGTLQPFDAPIYAAFETEKNIESSDYSGLVIDIMPESQVYPNEKTFVQFRITNNTDRPLYNFSTTLGDYIYPGQVFRRQIVDNVNDSDSSQRLDGYVNYREKEHVIPGLNKCGQTCVLQGNDTILIPTLEVGESIYGTYEAYIDGDKKDVYYTLVDSMVNVLEGEELNVTINIKPISSHVYKDILNIEARYFAVGDPVDMSTGGYIDEYEVLNLKGKNEMSFNLYYDSTEYLNEGEVGFGWHHNYESKIEDNSGLIYWYINPSSYISFISEDSYNGVIYGSESDDVITYSEDETIRDIKYKSITPYMDEYVLTRKSDGSYLLVTPEGTEYYYDSYGRLSCIKEKSGVETRLSYNQSETVIEDEYGNRVSLIYDNGYITEIRDNTGRSAKLTYSDRKITTIEGVDGNSFSYEYNDEGILKKGCNALGEAYIENTYDEFGRVLTQVDSYGSVITFEYVEDENDMTIISTNQNGEKTKVLSNSLGYVTEITKPDGSKEENIYDDKGRIITTSDGKGITYNYSHDEKGQLTGFTSSAGDSMTFGYDEYGNITSFRDNDDSYVEMEYDGYDLISMDRNGIKTTYGYNADGLPCSVTAEGNGTAYYEYDGLNISRYTDALGHVTNYDYDSRGNLISITDAEGSITRFNYDASDRITDIIKPNGGVKSYTYDMYGAIASEKDELGNVTSYTYDTAGNIKAVTYPDGSKLTYDYDINGRCTSLTRSDGNKIYYEYDISGNVTGITYPDGTSESYTYDAYGRKTSYTDKDGKTVTYELGTYGTIDSIALPDGETVDIGYNSPVSDKIASVKIGDTEYKTGYDTNGNIASITDAMGYTTLYDYNIYGELLSGTDANGNTTNYEYDSLGNVISTTYPDGTRIEYSYDRANRLEGVKTKVNSDEEEKTISVSYVYDADGNITASIDEMGVKTIYEYDPADRLTAVKDETGTILQSYTYDSMGRVSETGYADGSKAAYTYDVMGNLIKQIITSAGGEVKSYSCSYDINGLPVSATDTTGITASQSFDKSGNLISVVYPEGGGISYTYDDRNRLIKEKLSIGTEYSYEYNADNLLSKYTNGRGQETTYEYDKLGRITSATDEIGTISYTYDGCGNVLTVSETDKDGNTQTIRRTYDCMNRVSSYTDYKGNTVKYGYDELGNLISLTYAGGEIVRYKYYDNGALKEVIDTENLVTSYTYDKRGNLLTTQNPDGTTEVNTYDNLGQLATRTLYKAAAGESNRSNPSDSQDNTSGYGEVVYSYTYTYDDWGNITGISYKDNLSDKDKESDGLVSDAKNETELLASSTMTYDSSNRMITYNGEKIEYDDDGNMTYGPLNGKMRYWHIHIFENR